MLILCIYVTIKALSSLPPSPHNPPHLSFPPSPFLECKWSHLCCRCTFWRWQWHRSRAWGSWINISGLQNALMLLMYIWCVNWDNQGIIQDFCLGIHIHCFSIAVTALFYSLFTTLFYLLVRYLRGWTQVLGRYPLFPNCFMSSW